MRSTEIDFTRHVVLGFQFGAPGDEPDFGRPRVKSRNGLKWRRGYESNIPRLVKRADNGFEDREGHQAPITLLGTHGKKIEHRTSNIEHRTLNSEDRNCDTLSPAPFKVQGSRFKVRGFLRNPLQPSKPATAAAPDVTASL